MKRLLETLINKVFIDDLELMYGKGSYIKINNVKYCTTNKHFLIDYKLYVSDPVLFEEIFLGGVEMLVSESWSWTGIDNDKILFTVTYDLI
jgi:hypothetical protein